MNKFGGGGGAVSDTIPRLSSSFFLYFFKIRKKVKIPIFPSLFFQVKHEMIYNIYGVHNYIFVPRRTGNLE